MLGKLALLMQGKLAVAAVGTVIVVGGGSAAFVATGQSGSVSSLVAVVTATTVPTTTATVAATAVGSPSAIIVGTPPPPATPTAVVSPTEVSDGSRGKPVDELVGTLIAYDTSQQVLTMQVSNNSLICTVAVSDTTKIDGVRAKSSAALTAAVGSHITVHALVQRDGSLVAVHVIVTDDNVAGEAEHHGQPKLQFQKPKAQKPDQKQD